VVAAPRPRRRLGAGRALAAGLLHGPAELLPVSSSAHTALVAGGSDKPFEVALHAGSLPGLLALGPWPRPWFAALSVAPAALAGLAFEGPIERRLGTPAGIAAGLLAGSAALAAAARRCGTRTRGEATAADALALGAAQALALAPGVSRTGATLAAARARGFAPTEAWALSREAAVPVLAGATALKLLRVRRDGVRDPAALALGTAAACASGLAAARVLPTAPALGPLAAYRVALAAWILRAD
jgi:undecaprenyl-diphosphatase